MEMLGMIISSAEYKAIDNDGSEVVQENDPNQTSIELNVNQLSIKKIRYLQNFLNNRY